MELADIGQRFSEERQRLGYTQASFARLLGLSRTGLVNIEAGKSDFKVGQLASAASAGVDIQYVVTGVRSKNVDRVEDKIGFEKQAITGNISGIGFVGDGASIVINHNPRTTIKAETKPGEEHISLEQRSILQKLVDDVVIAEEAVRHNGKSHRAVWSALNRHCKVNTYTLIAASDFEKARKYLHQWLGRINSMPSAPIKNGDAWRKSRYAYIHANTKTDDAKAALRAYIKRLFHAESLTELSNQELDKTYEYVGRLKR